ncbi:hypothetical protein GH714_012002 [Hevea brasiliensis]|uniref:Uncharacterized protein n=1 Tax=Hevea brasiliensis TaxID=3981 RepID=A0A6A6K571_HEVBR|nr:hypothetical protein GH714_012002 [Hevea brasiliensis]
MNVVNLVILHANAVCVLVVEDDVAAALDIVGPSYGRRSYSPRGRSPKRRSISPRGHSYSKSPPYRGREELPYANG